MPPTLARPTAMGTPFFHHLKNQASFFLKEKIRTARLAFTDTTPAELLAEEVTGGRPWAPDSRAMRFISRAAFEVDDYWRIVAVLHKRLSRFDRKRWRESYNALLLLERLLTHGPESVSEEFHSDREIIEEMGSFQFVDEKGFNWGLAVQKKSVWVLKLLEKGSMLREERDRARKVTRGIEGFGSCNHRWASSTNEDLGNSSNAYPRSNSHYEVSSGEENASILAGKESASVVQHCQTESGSVDIFSEFQSGDEARAPPSYQEDASAGKLQDDDHPFNNLDEHESLLLISQS